MAKILISWIAFENDFIKGEGKPNPYGPTVTVHKHYYIYDKHIILTSAKNTDSDTRLDFLVNYLNKEFKHQIETKAMSIDDVIDVAEIVPKVEALLLSHKSDEVDVFISPGTPAMQVAWYLVYNSTNTNLNLFQLRRPEHTKLNTSQQIWIDITKSSVTASYVIKQSIVDESMLTKETHVSKTLQPQYDKAKNIASSDHVSVFITGESGTGKEKMATYIHDNSPRSKSNFVPINCSALTDELANSILFGHEKGAFTGALERTEGFFHKAEGGTIFLDEIGDISPFVQKILLRVLQENVFIRVGSKKYEKCNVRILTATRKNLIELINTDKFREDLYYRINVCEIDLPPLRNYSFEEREGIFDFIWEKQKQIFKKKLPKLSKTIKKKLLEYPYPGNIREMENAISGIIAEATDVVEEIHLPKRMKEAFILHSLNLDDIERMHIKKVFEMTNNNITKTAKLVGRSVNTVKERLKELEIL